jgi:hypothetical protein
VKYLHDQELCVRVIAENEEVEVVVFIFFSFPTHNYLPTVIVPLSNPLDCKTERRYSYQLSIELLATIFCNFQQQKEKRNK